ncbi:hypothetical protein CO692_01345 [Enterococcus sp. FDAARGOS_375]|nr:hypothetical protein CO692_01345 [Enterococcus sp. FDAARGOS_375]
MTKTSFPILEGQKHPIDCFGVKQLVRVLIDFIRKSQVLLFTIHRKRLFIKKMGIRCSNGLQRVSAIFSCVSTVKDRSYARISSFVNIKNNFLSIILS